jgi:hypothetical protein
MGYVKITLGLGISYEESDWNDVVLPRLLEFISKETGEIWDIEDDEDDDLDYDLKSWFEENHKLTWNYGDYHSEITLAFILTDDDSDIRTGQDFNFEFEKSDLNIKVVDQKILELLELRESDLIYQVMVYNY